MLNLAKVWNYERLRDAINQSGLTLDEVLALLRSNANTREPAAPLLDGKVRSAQDEAMQ